MEQNVPVWVLIISSLGGVAGLWAIVWTIINIRPKRKQEKASADKAQGEADGIDLQNFEKSLGILGARVVTLEKELTAAYEKMGDLRKVLTETKDAQFDQNIHVIELTKEVQYANRMKCDVLSCTLRHPPLIKKTNDENSD